MTPLVGRRAPAGKWLVNELSLFRIAYNDIDNPDLPALAADVRRELIEGGRDALLWLATRPSSEGIFEAVERGFLDREWAEALADLQASMGLER